MFLMEQRSQQHRTDGFFYFHFWDDHVFEPQIPLIYIKLPLLYLITVMYYQLVQMSLTGINTLLPYFHSTK